MKSHTVTRALLPLAFCALGGAAFAQQPAQPAQPQAPQEKMSFFITSVGKNDGGNLGGLAGADAHCETLAAAAGRGEADWRAYLRAAAPGQRPINARDRIGVGPGTTQRAR